MIYELADWWETADPDEKRSIMWRVLYVETVALIVISTGWLRPFDLWLLAVLMHALMGIAIGEALLESR